MASAGIVIAARFSLDAVAVAEPRVVVLVVRDMAFHVDGEQSGNPTLRFKAGEKVRLVLRNEVPGMTHDFAVPGWRVATRALQGVGSDVVTVTVPTRPGQYEYICNPHSVMMRGSIEVE